MKICNRDYSPNTLLSTKDINGVACCPNCEKPTICHNKPVEQRALFWALSGDTGISSEAIANHMTGSQSSNSFGMQPPSDSSDRGRCIRLLELIPEWLPRLNEMTQYDKKQSQGIVISSSGVSDYHNSWATQIAFILKEGKL